MPPGPESLAWIITPHPETLEVLRETVNDYLGLESTGFTWERRAIARLTAGRPAVIIVDSQDAPVAIRNELVRRLRQHSLEAVPVVICYTNIERLGPPWPDLFPAPNVGLLERPFTARQLVDAVLRLRTAIADSRQHGVAV